MVFATMVRARVVAWFVLIVSRFVVLQLWAMMGMSCTVFRIVGLALLFGPFFGWPGYAGMCASSSRVALDVAIFSSILVASSYALLCCLHAVHACVGLVTRPRCLCCRDAMSHRLWRQRR